MSDLQGAEHRGALRASRRPSDAVLDHVGDGDDLILRLGSGEPPTVLDALEAAASTGIGLAGAVAREPSG